MSKSDEVLLIGDSISLGYCPFVTAELADRCQVRRRAGICGDSRQLRAELDLHLAEAPAATLVHFNCGLHDLRCNRETGQLQVPLESYRANLRLIVERLAATGKKLIWARITPVIFERHRLVKPEDRREEDVAAFNAAADAIMAEAGIPLDDLHGLIVAAGKETYIREDGVHFTEAGSQLLGRQVAKVLRQAIGCRL
jgi:lysophospholipase L1-like esterase